MSRGIWLPVPDVTRPVVSGASVVCPIRATRGSEERDCAGALCDARQRSVNKLGATIKESKETANG